VIIVYLQKINNSKKQSNFIPQETRKININRSKSRSKLETRKAIVNIHENRSWFLEKLNKMEETLIKLRKRERTQINF
jgi:hypothetical protein